MGTGQLIKPAPDYTKVYGFEINPVTNRISHLLYPGINLYPNITNLYDLLQQGLLYDFRVAINSQDKGYFETAFLQPDRFNKIYQDGLTWLKGYPFDLVIGNPPYGIYKNIYSFHFNKVYKQIEVFFILKGLELLKKDGILMYLVSSNFMRTGFVYSEAKKQLDQVAEFVTSVRLPSVFRFSAVPVDIVIFRKIKEFNPAMKQPSKKIKKSFNPLYL